MTALNTESPVHRNTETPSAQQGRIARSDNKSKITRREGNRNIQATMRGKGISRTSPGRTDAGTSSHCTRTAPARVRDTEDTFNDQNRIPGTKAAAATQQRAGIAEGRWSCGSCGRSGGGHPGLRGDSGAERRPERQPACCAPTAHAAAHARRPPRPGARPGPGLPHCLSPPHRRLSPGRTGNKRHPGWEKGSETVFVDNVVL